MTARKPIVQICPPYLESCRINWAVFSAIIRVGEFVLPDVIVGMSSSKLDS